VAAGAWRLRPEFNGALNDKLRGYYRSTYKDPHGVPHIMAATPFEATDARRAIPCWDEPALKASFKVRLVIDEGLSAFSNAGVESERSLGGGKKAIVYKETIKMSTYLLASLPTYLLALLPTYLLALLPTYLLALLSTLLLTLEQPLPLPFLGSRRQHVAYLQ